MENYFKNEKKEQSFPLYLETHIPFQEPDSVSCSSSSKGHKQAFRFLLAV